MSNFSIGSQLPIYLGLNGSGLNGGKVYIGMPNQDPQIFPKTVYWDEAGTDPVDQVDGIATIGGYISRAGNPAAVYTDGPYSIRALDRFGNQVFYIPNAADAIANLIVELAGSGGSGLVGFEQTGSGAILRDVEEELRETIKVTQFSGANDVAMFNAALAAHPGHTIVAPKLDAPYVIDATIMVPDDTTISFEYGAKCVLGHDGAAFELGENSFIRYLDLDGAGATYPNGKGVIIDGAVRGCGLVMPTIQNMGSYCIDFLTNTAGAGFKASDLKLSRYDSSGGPLPVNETRAVINIATDGLQVEAMPRTFTTLSTGGWATINTGSCNGLVITGGDYWGPFYFNDNSRGVTITGGRWGNQTACDIKGANITIAACDISAALTITPSDGNGSGQSISVEANSMNNPRVIDNSGYPSTNLVTHRALALPEVLVLKADGTPLTVAANNNRNAIYRNGTDYCLDVDIQGSWQGGIAPPAGLGATLTLTIDIPADYMPKYEQFVGPINMTYNGSQVAVYGRLFGTTTGAGNLIRLGTLNATGAFTNITGGAYNAGPITRLRGTFRWTRGEL